ETREYLSVERTVSRRPFRALLDVGILIGGCFEEKELIGEIHRKTNLVGMLPHTCGFIHNNILCYPKSQRTQKVQLINH
ncbi:hypothetical protein MKW98_004253, partial [Papaver atlanticum]